MRGNLIELQRFRRVGGNATKAKSEAMKGQSQEVRYEKRAGIYASPFCLFEEFVSFRALIFFEIRFGIVGLIGKALCDRVCEGIVRRDAFLHDRRVIRGD